MFNFATLLKYKIPHLFLWVLLFGVWYFLRYQDFSTPAKAFTVTLIKVVDLAIMICITNYLLIPRLLYKKKYGWFICCFVLVIITSSVLKMNILGRVLNSPQLYSLGGNLKARIYDNVIPHFFLVTAGAAIKLMLDYGRLQQRLAVIAREKAEAELNFLKSQVNPHFLFNSLNAVYFLIDKENAAARNALHQFSALLRYQLYEMNDASIPIEKEIRFLQDYVALQKLRTDEAYVVDFNCQASVKDFSIEPLLLIPFVENAFKHISHFTHRVNFIKIELFLNKNMFHCKVENSGEPANKNNNPHSGIGLTNVKKRLALLYPGKHELHIKAEQDIFSVHLSLQLQPTT